MRKQIKRKRNQNAVNDEYDCDRKSFIIMND